MSDQSPVPVDHPARNRIDTLLWDVGGTLVSRTIDWHSSAQKALSAVGLNPDLLTPERFQQVMAYFEANEPSWRTAELERAGYKQIAKIMAGEEADEKTIQKLADQLALYPRDYKITPGIPALLQRLNDLGYRQAVVSNWPPSLRRFLAWHGLDRYFQLIVISGEEGVAKPDPDIFQRAMERLKVEPHRSAYIGNDPYLDIAPSRSLGITPVHFDPEMQFPGAEARTVDQLVQVLSRHLGLSPDLIAATP